MSEDPDTSHSSSTKPMGMRRLKSANALGLKLSTAMEVTTSVRVWRVP
jgi:hypothetical protein